MEETLDNFDINYTREEIDVLIPFDIEKAKNGANVVTRDGREVRIICYDRDYSHPIVFLFKRDKYSKEILNTCHENGRFEMYGCDTDSDLLIKEKKQVIVKNKSVIMSKEEAEKKFNIKII